MWWLVAGFMAGSVASAGRPRVVTVVVQDRQGAPISNAWVRVPGTERERAVEHDTGVWERALVYEPDGSPRIFHKGMELPLTVTAPGFRPRRIVYRIRGRKNVIEVVLEPLPAASPIRADAETIDSLMEQWLRPPAAEEEEEN